MIGSDNIVPKNESIHRLRIKNRSIKCIKRIVLYHNASILSAMEIALLILKVRYFGIMDITALVN